MSMKIDTGIKYFINSEGVIHPIGSWNVSNWFVVNEKLETVYTLDGEGCVTGEYTLWNSLTELAHALEGTQ